MFIELVDHLRCVRNHDDTWLVATAYEMSGRAIVRGLLGCPVCKAEYPIDHRIALFDLAAHHTADSVTDALPAVRARANAAASANPGADPSPHHPAGLPGTSPHAEDTMRCAAMLGLTDPGGFAVLTGRWAHHAQALWHLCAVHMLLVNPSPATLTALGDGVSALRTRSVLPLAPHSAKAVALDPDSEILDVGTVVRALRPRARLLAPASLPLPAGVKELARDHAVWVAEPDITASPPTPLTIDRKSKR
jgi:hypothetical protein